MSNLVVRQRRAASKQVEQAVRDHGKTTPMKLEEKRVRLSQTEQLIEAHIGQLKAQLHQLDKEKKLTPEIVGGIGMQIANLQISAGMICGLGAIVDCLSTRLFIKTKKGKSGHRRYSIANFLILDQRFNELETIVESLKKMSGYVEPDDDDEEEDDSSEEEEMVEEKP